MHAVYVSVGVVDKTDWRKHDMTVDLANVGATSAAQTNQTETLPVQHP